MSQNDQRIWIASLAGFAGAALLPGVFSVAIADRKPPRYGAECGVRLVPKPPPQDQDAQPPGIREVQQESDRIQSRKTFLTLIGNLSLDRYYERKFHKRGPMHEHAVLVNASSQTDAVPSPQPDILTIHVIESDPTMADALANELAAIPAKALDHADFPIRSSVIQPATVPLARIFHRLSSRGAAKARLARRPKRFRAGLYGDILSGEDREANAARRACSQPQQKECEASGLGPDRSFAIGMGMAVLLGSTFEAGLTGGVVWACRELRHRRAAG